MNIHPLMEPSRILKPLRLIPCLLLTIDSTSSLLGRQFFKYIRLLADTPVFVLY